MLQSNKKDQAELPASRLEALRAPLLCDWNEASFINLPWLSSNTPDLPNSGRRSQTQQALTLAEYCATEEGLNLIQWSSMAPAPQYLGHGVRTNLIHPLAVPVVQASHDGSFTVILIPPAPVFPHYCFQHRDINPENLLLPPTIWWSISPDGEVITGGETTAPQARFASASEVLTYAPKALRTRIPESERQARRRRVLSTAVSKNGHLSFLVPTYRRVCVETAARDQVIHLEVITLAEEQDAPGASAVGQILALGRSLWTTLKNRSLHLLLGCSEKTSLFGSTGAGLNFANAVAP